MAFLYIQEKMWGEAEFELMECIEVEPGNGLCNHTLGVVLLIQGNRIEATKRFEEAARLDSFYRLQYERLGALRGERVILTGTSETKLIEHVENPHRADLHRLIGEWYAEMGKTAKALQEFQKASRIYPNDYRCHLSIGKLYDLQGAYGKAIEEFQEAVGLSPDCGTAYAEMSYAYAAMGDLDKALASLKKAVGIHPQYADLRYQLGVLYEDLDMCSEAIDELTQALKIDPKYLFARIHLGVLYEKTGQMDKALEEYEIVAELVTEDKTLVDRIDQIKKQKGSSLFHAPSSRL